MPSLLPALTYRRRQVVCGRCRTPVGTLDDFHEHICHDRVRHPRLRAFLDGLGKLMDDPPSLEFAECLQRARRGDVSRLDGEEAQILLLGFEVAWAWADLPRSERRVAQAILDHAGVELDLEALAA